jgi:hypothetical protein
LYRQPKSVGPAKATNKKQMTDAEKLTGRLMGLKFRMEDYYLRDEKPNSEYSFGYFLKAVRCF